MLFNSSGKIRIQTRLMVKWTYTSLAMTNRYCQAVGNHDAVEVHSKFYGNRENSAITVDSTP